MSDDRDETFRAEAESIIDAVGGKENIKVAAHCLTRLRLVLVDDAKIDRAKLKSIALVKGSFLTKGQFQVIIGAGTVDKVCDTMLQILGIDSAASESMTGLLAKESRKKLPLLQRGLKDLAEIFIPILPAIVTAGLLLGLNNILANPGIFYADKSFIQMHPGWESPANMILVLATTAFLFLPALIGWSATKKFGGSPLLGLVFGIALVHPDLLSQYALPSAILNKSVPHWEIFGLAINKVGYQGQVLPVLVASFILAKVENFLKKVTPDMIKLLVVFPVSLLVVGILTYTLIGPITLILSEGITRGVQAIFSFAPVVGGLIYGLFYAPLVITGLHNIFLAVDLQLIGTTGSTFLWPILALSNIAQGTAALTMMFIIKKKSAKALPLSSGISAWLGITEPAMFGVNLQYKFPFLAAIAGAGLGGAFIMSNHVKAQSVGIGGIPAFLSVINTFWMPFFIGMAIVIVLPAVFTIILSRLPKYRVVLADEGLLTKD